MAQAPRLIRELKRQLKQRGLTYRALATHLSLSESAVKQMFAGENMSLHRLDSVCDVLGIDISELVQISDANSRHLQALTLEQEAELIGDPKLLLHAYCLVNHWSFEDITSHYCVSETEGVRYLAKLDRMKLIELLPGNRVRPLIASNFEWQQNGPIETYFRQEVQREFFNSRFDEDGCLHLVKNGDVSHVSRQQILERLHAIGQQFDDTVWEERKLPRGERQGTTMVLAIRNWGFAAFTEFERLSEE